MRNAAKRRFWDHTMGRGGGVVANREPGSYIYIYYYPFTTIVRTSQHHQFQRKVTVFRDNHPLTNWSLSTMDIPVNLSRTFQAEKAKKHIANPPSLRFRKTYLASKITSRLKLHQKVTPTLWRHFPGDVGLSRKAWWSSKLGCPPGSKGI